MKKVESFQPEFVDVVPDDLEAGTLYISIRYRTASHLCACGCKSKVVTPIRPPKWHMTFDGDTVSLAPSVGNWQLPCRSHYWIRNGRVEWAKPWTDEEIEAGRERDAALLRHYNEQRGIAAAKPSARGGRTAQGGKEGALKRLWQKVWKPG